MERPSDQIQQEIRRRLAATRTAIPAPPVIPSAPPPVPSRLPRPPQLPPWLRRSGRSPAPAQSLLTLEELERFKNLLVFAKMMVEGYFAGKHKSPWRGSSAEFADYKEYVAGEDVSRIDWRVYGRNRRLYVRQFEEETDLVVYLLVDSSASMRYAGEKRAPKFQLAAKLAASLAYLMIHQGDKAALGLFADKLREVVPPGGTRRHLHRLVTALERARPASTTGLAQALGESNAVFKKRGRIVILSDFLDDLEEVFDALARFIHRKFEILLLHLLDPDELKLPPFHVAKFVDLETGEQIQVDPGEIRATYEARMKQFVEHLARESDRRQVSYSLVNTRNPYLEAIEAYLGFRGRTSYLNHAD